MEKLASIFALIFHVPVTSNAAMPDEPGFDYQYRLPRDWMPITYRLKIFYEESAVTVPAELCLTIMAERPTQKLVLHAFSPSIKIKEAKLVRLDSRKKNVDLGDPIITMETVNYSLPIGIYRKIDYGTTVELIFKYTFTVNETSVFGPYRVTDYAFNNKNLEENATRIDLFTQFSMIFARRLFPCFDEPEYKAIFYLDRFEFHRKSSLKAVVLSNSHGKLLSTANSTEIWTFPKPTPKMSTYLFAVLVGSYEHFYTYGPLGGTPPKVTFWYQKSVNLTESVLASRRVISDYEKYFNIRSPVEKFDFAFVSFAFSGMENWGLIGMLNMFSLTGENSSMVWWSGENTLIHEILHQWFGNIITPKWWTDVWIKEGLSEFYTHNYLENVFKPTVEKKKKRRKEVLFYNHPIRLEQFGSPWTSAYAKTPWILKMLEAVVGKETFLSAIRNLLADYSFHPVSSDDFFRVFQREVDNKGLKGWDSEENLNIRQFLYNWLFEAGYPKISATWNSTANSFTLSQSNEEGLRWYVPIWYSRTDWTEWRVSETLWLTPKENLVVEVWVGDPKVVEWDPKVVGSYWVETENVD